MNSRNFRTLDLNLLRVFDAVMSERSLTRAARQLALTQPAVSNALQRLRDALGDDLLRRDGLGMQPTPTALALWPAVRDALHTLQEAISPSRFEPAHTNMSFVLAMADATAAQLMPGLLTAIEHQAPGVTLRVLPLTTRDPRTLLEQETVDLAVGFFPAVVADLTARAQAGERVSFEHRQLYDGEYVCVMRREHPLAQQRLTLDSYCAARHLLVSFSGRPYGFIDESLARLGRQRRIALTVNQFFTAGRVVTQSDLLTVLPSHFIEVTGYASQVVWQPLPFAVPPVQVDTLWHHRRHNQSAHQWLRDRVLEAAQRASGQS